ncbi:ABC transporter ATP-binding protein [Paenibacillus sp. BIHB 4019]|uniref:ABC transporter ATP-binding protein n=1 Tax=Paenibacillus sp. BIHB 4019 TaxID=1870819 RepID=UPI00155952EF|nr:ABC transporter ATP-binding protein [Paenibacillus sp. BIHB 4019]
MTIHPLQIENLSKTIRGKSILQNISLEVRRGEIFGLLGPNGAGKTTLFRLIANLIFPTQGSIYINGINANQNHVLAAKHIGAIIETPHMYPFLTAYQNLVHFSLYSQQEPDKNSILEILKVVGLQEAARKKVKTFSLGMKQRLGLAQALLHNPDLILLDEPTNGMDPVGMKEFRDYLHHLTKEQNKTVIISSHLLNEMEMICDRVAFIVDGEVKSIESMQKTENVRQVVTIEIDSTERALPLLRKHERTSNLLKVEESELVFLLLREEISEMLYLLIHHQIHVYAVQSKQPSLEDKFMSLTEEASIDKAYKSRAN